MDSVPSVEMVFEDYEGRRNGIIRALTTDLRELFTRCDPEKDLMHINGHPDGTWSVDVWNGEVRLELPYPSLGIDFEPDEAWFDLCLTRIASYYNSWLIANAYWYGHHFDKDERERLFTLINSSPTVIEVLAQYKGFDFIEYKRKIHEEIKYNSKLPDGDQTIGADKGDYDTCGICSGKKEFWIMCNTCEGEYHGKCVGLSPSQETSVEPFTCHRCRDSYRF